MFTQKSNAMKIELKQIGIVHSPFKTKEETPIQPFKSDQSGEVEVFKDFEEGLEGKV